MTNRTAKIKIATLLNMILGTVFLLASIIIVAVVTYAMHTEAIDDAKQEANLILKRNLATHHYFTHDLKPKLFNRPITGQAADYFEPTWMSSTYAIRQIDKIFKSSDDNLKHYYYKECAINARSLENEANEEYEKDFIKKLNADPSLVTESKVRKSPDGKPFFVTLHRGEVMEQSCLRCHSTPDAAPADMVKKYGSTGSFNRREGETISAVSIRIPLAVAYAKTRVFSLKLSALMLSILFALFSIQYFLTKRIILKPLNALREKSHDIAFNDKHLGENLPMSPGLEFNEVAISFNSMSEKLKHNRDNLEAMVQERTAELETSNRKLRQEIFDRQKVENELTHQKYLLDKAQEIGFVGSWELDLTTDNLTWSEETHKILGFNDNTQLTYDSFIKSIHPDDKEYVDTSWQKALKGESYDIEHRILIGNNVKWVREKAEMHRDKDQKYIKATGFIQDITQKKQCEEQLHQHHQQLEKTVSKRTAELQTANNELKHEIQERKLAENAIRASEDKFAKAFIASPDCVCITTVKDGEFVEVNQGFYKLSGYTPDEAIGKTTLELGLWADPNRRAEFINNIKHNGRAENEEFTVRTKSGSLRHATISTERLTLSGKEHILSIIRDITDRKESEHQLEQMALFAKLNPDPVIRFNATGDILSANPAAIDIFGEHAQPGLTLEKLLPCCCDLPIEKCIETDGILKKECRIGDITYHFVILGVSSLSIAQLYGTDITERKNLEEKEKERLSQLAHVSRLTTAGELASSLAHELNQPLCAISTIAEGCKRLIEAGNAGPGDIQSGISDISDQASRAGIIIRRIGQFVKKHQPTRSTVNIDDLLTESIDLIATTARHANVQITQQSPKKRCCILADKILLQQVLVNLMRNGIEAIQEAGTDGGHMSVTASTQNGRLLEIAITDTGKGIPPETAETLFEPFFTTKKDGIGIGLAISRSIVEAHGGYLSVDSTPNKGTTFKFTLPINAMQQ